jgi:hypothetical protein
MSVFDATFNFVGVSIYKNDMDFDYILKIICDYVFLLCIPGDVFGVCVTHFGKQMSTYLC